jgi:hypothetical protein
LRGRSADSETSRGGSNTTALRLVTGLVAAFGVGGCGAVIAPGSATLAAAISTPSSAVAAPEHSPTPDHTELYDPVANTFVAGPPINEDGCNGRTATVLGDGRVLIEGDCAWHSLRRSDYGTESDAALFDPVTNTIQSAGTLNARRYFAVAALLPNDKVLVAGGAVPGSSTASSEIYDPAANNFVTGPQMTESRSGAMAVRLPKGKVLIAGGFGGTGGPGGFGDYLATTEIYDPAPNSFAPGPAMNAPRANATATLLSNGKVLIAGGENLSDNGHDAIIAETDLYDPVSNRFSMGPVMKQARKSATSTLLSNGKVLIAGGMCCTDISPPRYLASSELYDPVTNTFAVGPPMNTPRIAAAATLIPNGKVLIAGGTGHDYGPPIPLPRSFEEASVIPCRSSGYLASTELFDPATNRFAPGPLMSAPRSEPTASLLHDGRVFVASGYCANQ